jgi:hypothetical protein
MICTTPVLKINPNECIGDSVGKHNYNFLLLDTSVCNLSSQIYLNQNQLSTVAYTLTNLASLFQSVMTDVTQEKTEELLLAATTVELLSSYWGNYEFSITLPINAVTLNNNDILLCPLLSSVTQQNINSIVNGSLKNVCLQELNNNYSAQNFYENTIVNVSLFLYNLIPSLNPAGQETSDSLIRKNYLNNSPPVFSFNQRQISVNYNRDNVYITSGLILRFIVNNSQWEYMGYVHDSNSSTANPNQNIQAIYQTYTGSLTASSIGSVYLNTCTSVQPNTWYSCDVFAYANAVYAGTSSKLGSITLTLRAPNNQTTVFSYTAPGYSPATNTGGNDVYLEYAGEYIYAYVSYPTQKNLVQTWVNPYYGQTGINFKYTYDGNGVSFNVCASNPV